MDIDRPIRQGLLLLPPQDMFGRLKKSWHKKFCLLFKASNFGIERLEAYDSKDDYLIQQPAYRIVTLEACIKIRPSNQPRVFAVVTKNNTNNTSTYYFGCLSELDKFDWMSAFQKVAFNSKQIYSMIEEDNELYCSSDEGVFIVKLVETEASKRCKLEEKVYTLIVTESDIKLKDNDNGLILFEWPFRYIRKYGYRDDKFSFEAGRKCKSGEGVFNLERSNQQQIYRCISSKINSMKKLLRPELTSTPSSTPASTPTMDEAQYHAALHMEPGSRSPLPPTSINSDNNLIDIDFSTCSQQSLKPLTLLSSSPSISSSSSTCNLSTNTNSFIRLPISSIIKSKPAKPPRKYNINGHCDLTNEQNHIELSGSGNYRQLNTYKISELCSNNNNSNNNNNNDNNNNNNNSSSSSSSSNNNNDNQIKKNYQIGKNPYDLVEVRCDAWRTLGVDTVVHIENDKHQSNNDIKFTRLISDDDDNSDDNNNIHNFHVEYDDDIDDDDDDDDDDCGKSIMNDIIDEDIDNDDNHKQIVNSNNNNSNDFIEPYEISTSLSHTTSTSTPTITQERITIEASPIINHNLTKSNSMDDYDQLQHFGSIHKLNNSSGYRKCNPLINNVTINKNQSTSSSSLQQNGQQKLTTNDESNHSWADYELADDLSSVRLADDSSNGYGVIRKKPNASGPQQQTYSNNDYAIVSKPKKV